MYRHSPADTGAVSANSTPSHHSAVSYAALPTSDGSVALPLTSTNDMPTVSSRKRGSRCSLCQQHVPLWAVILLVLPLFVVTTLSTYPHFAGTIQSAPVITHAVVQPPIGFHNATNLCGAQYAPLYESISQSLALWDGKLTQAMMLNSAIRAGWHVNGGVTIQIKDSRMYVVAWSDGIQSRQHATLLYFWRLLNVYKQSLPRDALFTFGSGDFQTDNVMEESLIHPTFSYSRRTTAASFLIPDFSWIAWPEADLSHNEIVEDINRTRHEYPFSERYERLFARFAPLMPQRERLIEQSLLHPDTMDVKFIHFRDDPNQDADDTHGPIIPLPDHCQYAYLAVPDGAGYAGRLQYLMGCGSVIVKPEPVTYLEFWNHLMRPNVNYVPYAHDAHDIHEVMLALRRDPIRAQRIADAAAELSDKYLTDQAVDCYAIQLLNSYMDACIDCKPLPLLPSAIPIERFLLEPFHGHPPVGMDVSGLPQLLQVIDKLNNTAPTT